MYSENTVSLIGHVGNDPEIRGDDKKVASLAFYTSETWKNAEGERQEKKQRHQLVAFRPGLVQLIENNIKKGAYLRIAGSLQYGSWTDNDGVERYSAEIVVDNLGFLERKPSDES